MVMNEEVLRTVQKFIDDNGNKHFTNKELIIYFNKKHESDIKRLTEAIEKLPCMFNEKRLVKIETTNKLIAGAVGVILTIFGLIISLNN